MLTITDETILGLTSRNILPELGTTDENVIDIEKCCATERSKLKYNKKKKEIRGRKKALVID